MNDETKDLILGVFETSLEAQLRAVRRLRQGEPDAARPRPRKGPHRDSGWTWESLRFRLRHGWVCGRQGAARMSGEGRRTSGEVGA